jgi:uncharacterized glyoxalase superfamily protein PhnB
MPTNWGVIPSIRVQDMKHALDFYTSTLGFKLTRGGPDEDNTSLDRNDAHIMIEKATAFYSPEYNAAIQERMGGRSPMALYIEAPDLEELDQKLRTAGAKVIDPLAARAWGQSELTVEDPEGNWLTFWKASAG